MKAINKKIDAVKMMREIRDKLNKEYFENPKKFERDLERINNRYNILKASKRKERIA
jgi:hypothetical protein